jgi:hypothetical protein
MINRRIVVSLLLAGTLIPGLAQAQFTGMRSRIPKDANTLVLFNTEKMFGSPVADRERWDARREAAYQAGISALPPDATEVVIASRTDHEFGKSIWELGMMKLSAPRNVLTVAQRFGGTVDEIEGRSAARLPDDHIIVQLTDTIMASHTPAERQSVSRWLRSTDTTQPGEKLSPYLERAFDYATEVGTPIIMAMDLEGAISPDEVKRRMETFELFQDLNVPADQIAALISGIHGITLGISLQEDTIGAIRVDFADSPAILAEIGKPLLIEILGRQGAMIDDIHDWTPSLSGNTFTLRGKMGTNGVRRVMSVLELPATLTTAIQHATSPGADPEGTQKLLATQQYYKSVNTLIEDLREKPKRDHVKTFGQAAMWYDRYARKIDLLPIMGVDEEMLDFGTQIASAFRDAEMTMKGVGMRTSQRTASNNPSSSGYYSSFGGYRTGMTTMGYSMFGQESVGVSLGPGRASLIEKGRTDAIIRGEERTAGAATVQQIWQAIDELNAKVRRSMTAKYSADF